MVSGDDMLKTTVWAVAGDVLNSSKPAYKVVQKLRQHNKTVYLINQRDAGKKDNITNDIVYSSVDELADKYIETLDLCINPVIGVQLIQQARNANINNIYAQPGADTQEVLDTAKKYNINIYQGCVLRDL